MTDDRWSRIKQIVDAFHEAQPDDPATWLDRRCGEDTALRREVADLLRADAEGRLSDEDRAVDRLPVEAPDDFSPEAGGVRPTDTVGSYRLEAEVGAGGMSTVYRARRTDADVEQTVAVKLLQHRLNSAEARRRFRAEQQVLASLDHPNIAQFIDGGVTDGGRPYLAMEYVDGTPITTYADERGLDRKARLDLIGQVAEALQAAHHQLVVHRDLKPSNVFVTETASGPQVTLLDFGIAKLLGDTLPVTRPQTQTGRAPLTLAYAAPEQVTGGDISTQTDVYQLGVLTYELLSGTRPFDLEDASLAGKERIITEKTPPPPSAQASDWALDEDLDTIILKALRKEPGRRYASVEAFAADLKRYRRGEPVEARPATFGYRARKFVRRNARAVAGVAAALTLIVGLTVFYVHRISEERDRAQREAEKAEAVAGYLTDLLQSTQPSEAGADTVTAAEMLRRGRRRINRLDDQPAVQARMLHLLGNAYRERAEYAAAESLFQRSLAIRNALHNGPHRTIANTLEELAHLQRRLNNYQRADSLWQKALVKHKRLFGPRSPELWEPLNNLGLLAQIQRRFAAADSFYQAALRAGRTAPMPDSTKLASTLQNMASLAERQRRYGRADSLYQRALHLKRQYYGSPHPSVATTLWNLGLLRKNQSRYAAADSLLRRALSMRRAVYSPPHPELASSLLSLGKVHLLRGQPAEAESILRRSLSMYRAVFDSLHPRVGEASGILAVSHTRQGQLRAADTLLRRAIAIGRETQGPQHPRVGANLASRGNVLNKQGRYQKAASLYREARAILREYFPAGHPNMVRVEQGLGRALVGLDRYRKAAPLLKRSLKVFRREDQTEEARETRALLATLYAEWGKPEKATQYSDAEAVEGTG